MSVCSNEQLRSIESILEWVDIDSNNIDNIDYINNLIREGMENWKDFDLNTFIHNKIVTDLFIQHGVVTEQKISEMVNNAPKNLTNSNVIPEISNFEVSEMFVGIPLAKSFFEKYLNTIIANEVLIGNKDSDIYVDDNESISKNLHRLKNEIYRDIQEFLKARNLLGGEITDLFDDNGGIIDHNAYTSVMNNAYKFFFKGGMETYSFNNKIVPNLNISIEGNAELFDIYNKLILLNNFDSVIASNLNHVLAVDFSDFNSLYSITLDTPKYSLKIDPRSTLYWNQDSHEADSSENKEIDIARVIVESIPLYNNHGIRKEGEYLEMKDLYLFGSLISNFESLYGNEFKNDKSLEFKYLSEDANSVLDFYIDMMINPDHTFKAWVNKPLVTKGNAKTGISLSNIRSVAHSLNNFINNPDLNIRKKEETSKQSVLSLITQTLKNNYGSMFSTYGDEYEILNMSQQNWNNISVNNLLIGKIAGTGANGSMFWSDDIDVRLKSIFERHDLYSSEELLFDTMKNLATGEIPEGFARDYADFINNVIGIPLHKNSLSKIIKDFIDSNVSWEENEVFNYSRLYQETKKLLENVKSDAESDDFKTYVKGRLFKGTSGLLKEVGVSPWYLSIRNAYLDDYVVKPMMNINSAKGSKMPSFKSSNLTFKDSEIINLQRIFENNFEEEFKDVDGVNIYQSLLTKNSPAVLGTSAKMEISKWDSDNKKMITKDAVDFTPSENFISDFQYDFLESLGVNNTFQIILGNYSDKKSIYTKIINGDFEFEYNNKNVKLLSLNNDDLLQVYRTQTKNYHQNALLSIFRDYKKVFKVAGINANINIKDNFDANLDSNINAINEVLRSKSITEINSEYAKNYDYDEGITGLTEELHYSSYNEGGTKIVQLNQMLIDIYKVFNNNSMFDAYIKKEEELFLTKYNKHLGSEHKLFSWISNNTIKKLGLSGAVTANDKNVVLKNGNINPLVKKWMWTNALMRGEYIYATAKGEYMHPHKKNSEIREFITPYDYKGGNYNEYFDKWMDDFTIERSGRLESMAKRNVIFTASIQPPTTHGKFVEPKKVNIAAIQDYRDSVFTTSGYSDSRLEVHDGSSYIDDTYSRAVDASQPGAGYSGTKKRFGTLITPFGVTIKKDAETQLTNGRIRESLNSKISLLNKKEQMLSIPIKSSDIDSIWNKDYSYKDIYYIDNGLKNKINSIVLSKSEDETGLNMTVNVFNDVEGHVSKNYKVDNLFEIWNNVGGIYNVDTNGNFTEASNDIMEDLITDNNRLFDKMIHILSNTSALKAGATAINPMSAWTENSRLLYTTYDNLFMGNQLDANQQADQSEIKEVTQMMAAIAQNGYTSDWAREVYKDLERIIEEAAKPYKRSLESSEDGLYKYMSEKFVDAINRTGSDGLAESIINLMNEDGVKIPFSNVTFFNQFVKNVITNLNSEFISRHYSGIGSVLIPSHGIIQLYDVISPTEEMIVATQTDILKRALAEVENNRELVGKSNEEILQHYLDNSELFKPIELIRNEDKTFPFEVGDWISINGDEAIEIKSPEVYYETQYSLKNNETFNVKRILNKTRDLKPTLHNFTVGRNRKNVYDFKSLEMLYELKAYEDKRPAINHDTKNTLDKLLEQYGGKDAEKTIRAYLQLEFALLDKGYIVDDVFSLDKNLTTMPINDVINRLSDKNVLKIVDSVEFKPAEKVISDIYKTNFGRDTNDSLFDINIDPTQYFKNILNNYFAEDDNEYDLKIITSRFDNPVYIKYVDNFSNRSNFGLNLKTEQDIEGNSSKTRYNRNGQKIYSIRDRFNRNGNLLLANDYYNITVDSKGNEVIEIKSTEQSRINNKGKIETEISINRELESNVKRLINSFGTSVKAVVPIRKGVDTNLLGLNNVTTNIFKNHYKNLVDIDVDKDSFINQLSAKIASSWKLSHEFIDARIPGQSMQSFMPMKNVAYMSGNTNDTYVSVNQIFMQGSDFKLMLESQ